MLKRNITNKYKTSIVCKNDKEGETIETKIERILSNKEPITDGAPLIYMERKDGVIPDYDIRTDRFDVAVDAMDKVTKTNIAKREQRAKTKENAQSNTGTEPPQTAA